MLESLFDHFLPYDAERLWQRACRRAGVSRSPEPEQMRAMTKLLRSYRDEARLNAAGRLVAINDVRRLLTQRLRMEQERAANPAIAEQEIRAPIFITGLPRTSTSLLHGLIASNPRFRAPMTWEVMEPTPAPGLAGRATTRWRIAKAKLLLGFFDVLAPGFQAIHEVAAEVPQECIAMLAHSGLSLRFVVTYRVPGYVELLRQADMRSAYRWHRQFLQHLQVGGEPRRWVLKAPAHLNDLAALLAVYPDATVIQTHRDPLDTLPSLASLRVTISRAFSIHVDAVEAGQEVLDWWADALRGSLAVREQYPDHFIDVDYRQLTADPDAVLSDVYARLNEPFTERDKARCRDYLAANPQGKHGQHSYRAEDYGFEREMLERAFADYRRERGFDRASPRRSPDVPAHVPLAANAGADAT